MLGKNAPLKWERVGKGALIEIPAEMINNPPCRYAWSFKISNVNLSLPGN
jgi:alpha-L-fucosidase